MGKLIAVVGGMFGSEGKGAVAAYLTHPARFAGAAVRIGGPNAGHTVIDPHTGRRWPLRHIPVAAVVNSDVKLILAAGSEIDLEVLHTEATQLEDAGYSVYDRLYVDPAATVLTNVHKARENAAGLVRRIGSTGKGIGAARSDRVMRLATLIGDLDHPGFPVQDTTPMLGAILLSGQDVLIEGTQGYGLGLHTSNYPQVTSTDCRAIDTLAQAGISPWHPGVSGLEIWMVVRPNPIRVAGNSGPLKDETTWADLGLPEEQTTVTHKTRRVGAWDDGLIREALIANGVHHAWGPGPVRLALTMADHLDPTISGATRPNQLTPPVHDLINRIKYVHGATVGLVGTGPDTVVDLRKE